MGSEGSHLKRSSREPAFAKRARRVDKSVPISTMLKSFYEEAEEMEKELEKVTEQLEPVNSFDFEESM